MPIFLDPLARPDTSRAQRLGRRHAALVALIALVVLAAAISLANRPEPVPPHYAVPAAAARVTPPAAAMPATTVAVAERSSAATVLWILLIAWTVVLVSLALPNRRERPRRAPLPPSTEPRSAPSPPELGLAGHSPLSAASDEHLSATDVTAANEHTTTGGNLAAQPRAPRRAGGSPHAAPAASATLTRAETHALRRSEPLKRVADRAPELEERWRQLGAETRRHREKPAVDWDRR